MTVALKLLGGIALENSDGPVSGQIAQRRRLAFLAILGVARRGVSRDRLVALLWPELDAEGARHRLSDSLYVARRALGESAIVAAGDDVRLSDAEVEVDVQEFERALDGGEAERAISIYRGPFLDGFHLGGEGEFDRWVDDERARLAARYAQALRDAASLAERMNDHAAAAEWLRRLAAVDPLDAKVTLALMRALEQSGNGAAALRHARVHAALRESELGLGEDAEVRRAADVLTARLAAEVHAARVIAAEAPLETVASSAPSLAPREPRSRSRFVAAGVAIVIVAVAVVALWNARARSHSPIASGADVAGSVSPGVAVFPFLIHGGDSTDVAGDALASLIATKLDGGAGMRSIDPNALLARYRRSSEHPDPADAARLARDLGARYFVLGDAVRSTGTLHLGAALYDANDGKPVDTRIGVEGKETALFELVDSLAARLLVERRGQPAPQLARLASLTTNSLDALKLYLDGESLGREGRYAEAAALFEQATAADSTFALAYYRTPWARGWIAGGTPDVKSLQKAEQYSQRLPERIGLTVKAIRANARGSIDSGETGLRDLIARHPDDFDANLWLGDMLFHANPPRGRSIIEARRPLEQAARLEPERSAEAMFHLVEIAAVEHNVREVDSLASRLLVLRPSGGFALGARLLLAVTRHDSARLDLVRREMAEETTVADLRTIAIVLASTPERGSLVSLLHSLNESHRPPDERARITLALAGIAGEQGNWAAADSLFVASIALDARTGVLARARFVSLPSLDPPTPSIRDARSSLAAARLAVAKDVAESRLLDALLGMRLGDLETARRVSAAEMPHDYGLRELWIEVTARRLLRVGHPDEALAVLARVGASARGSRIRFLHGEVLEALGRRAEAMAWYGVSAEDYGGELYTAAIAKARQRLSAR